MLVALSWGLYTLFRNFKETEKVFDRTRWQTKTGAQECLQFPQSGLHFLIT